MPISRLFRLLYILLERERVPAPELAQTLEVSVRTIYRDVQTLGEAGIPVYAERGRDGGVAILPTFRLNKSMVSAAEKQDMLAALQALASTGASDRETLGKLSAFFGGRQTDWVRIDFADWSGARDGLIPALKAAILNRQRLTFDYYNSSGVCATREVAPSACGSRAARGICWRTHAKARPAHLQAHAHQASARHSRRISRRGAGLHADRADRYSAGYAACPLHVAH